ncbi:MAG: hypothetical protein JJE22_13850, partial [Bacteroidia bacterium]|nr:hypothetical protein [Bacteroidia bacterium]
TTLWIGHLHTDPTDHLGGQTFKCPSEGMLDNIQLYSLAVQSPGEMKLTFHEFDTNTKSWGPAIANSNLLLQRGDDAKWITFELQPVPLLKDVTYGFRLETSNALIGIGEAATGTLHPFTFGQAWSGDSKDVKGHYYSYFSLAFKVALRA